MIAEFVASTYISAITALKETFKNCVVAKSFMKNEIQKLSIKAVLAWRIQTAVAYLLLSVVVLGVCFWLSLGLAVIIVAAVILIILFIVDFAFLTLLRQKHFSYIITDEYVKISSGYLFNRQTIVPIHKIAFVKQRQGPIVRRLGLVNIELGVLIDSLAIPCLTEEAATRIQETIISIQGNLHNLEEV